MNKPAAKSQYEKQFSQETARLNAEQRKAMEHIEGPVMVIAGPGTGKTQIIAARIGHILKSDSQVAPHNILCLTYTDAGTIAMRNRLLRFIGPTAYRVNIYTFHSFCNNIIQHNPDYFGKREMEPISELENAQLLRHIQDTLPPTHLLKRFKGDIYFDNTRLNNLFRMMKEEGWSAEHIAQKAAEYLADLPNRNEYVYKRPNSKSGIKVGDIKQKEMDTQKEKMDSLCAAANLFPIYNTLMHERNRYDYSDMILWVLNAFKKDKGLLQNYQEWYQYFLVDEFQDTSGAQNELMQLLIDFWNNPNVFVVGDDDQCIYEFQGARVKNMTRFFEKYESEIETVVLRENYRSTQIILDASKAVIDNNTQRLINQPPILKKIPNLTKTLIASNPQVGTSIHQPAIVQYYNILHEEADIVSQISKLKDNDINLAEVAILYAKHKQVENIINLLEKKSIPYSVKKKINILDLPVVNQLLNILTYLKEEQEKPHRGEYLLFEMMHYRFFGISPRDAIKIATHCWKEKLRWRDFLSNYDGLKNLKPENYGALISFEENLTRWTTEAANLTLQMLFEKILNWSGLLKQVLNAPDKIWQLQTITTLFDFIKSESSKHPTLSIKEFLNTISQMREAKIDHPINKTVYEENGVNLITVHSAKGLEFKYVYMIGCTSDIWEQSRGMINKFSLPDTLTFTQKDDENKLESARRLFYVGLTRAQEHLHLSFAEKNNNGKALEHSVYIEEILAKTKLQIEQRHLSADKIAEHAALALTESTPVKTELPDKEFLSHFLEGFEMTATHLNKYLQCPLVFYYESILRIPTARNKNTAFGTAAHNTLKWLFDEMKKASKEFPPVNILLNEFKKQLIKQRSAFNEMEFDNMMIYGELTLPAYYNKYIPTWNRDVKTEFTINNIEMEGVPINGNLDKIEFLSPGEVNVVDYKTGKPENGIKKTVFPNEKEVNGGDYWRQLVFYKILLDNFKREKWNMISGEIDFLEKESKTKDFVKKKIVVTHPDIAIVKTQIKETYAKIMNHEFTTGCGKEDCNWCNFAKSVFQE